MLRHRHRRRSTLTAFIAVTTMLTAAWFLRTHPDSAPDLSDNSASFPVLRLQSRQLQSHNHHHHGTSDRLNCTPAAVDNFPSPGLTRKQLKQGGAVLHAMLALYMFWGLAIVCDEYFVPACERICEVLKLESDVAGATFMAGGSSAPELAVSVIGVFIAKDDIALGAVVGSAFFNILFVIAFCALFAGAVIPLHWWPIVRDSLFYAASICALIITIYDGYVQWYEALCLILLYIVYCAFMFVNERLENFFVPRVSKFTGLCPATPSRDADFTMSVNNTSSHRYDAVTQVDSESQDGSSDVDEEEKCNLLVEHQATGHIEDAKHLQLKEEGNNEDLMTPPLGLFPRLKYAVSLPLALVIYVTTPDVRKPRFRRWVPLTFLMAIIWIGVFSYVMVWMIAVIGDVVGVSDTVMGLTFMAAGSSAPDVFSSYLVLKDGLGDMAVSNAIGSNIFDILLCIGIPYLIKTLMLKGPVAVFSHGLAYSSIALLSTVLLLPASLQLNGWRLDVKYGAAMMLCYVMFITVAVLLELNVFGHLSSPTCPRIDY